MLQLLPILMQIIGRYRLCLFGLVLVFSQKYQPKHYLRLFLIGLIWFDDLSRCCSIQRICQERAGRYIVFDRNGLVLPPSSLFDLGLVCRASTWAQARGRGPAQSAGPVCSPL